MSQTTYYEHPTTHLRTLLKNVPDPTVLLTDAFASGQPAEVAAAALTVTVTNPVTGLAVTARGDVTAERYNLLFGGEFIPHGALQGQETYLAENLAADATSMVVTNATHDFFPGLAAQNIFIPGQSYWLLHRKPAPGENPWATGTEKGLLKPAAEIITVGSGYTGGTTIPITRGATACARSRFAVIMALTCSSASYADDADKGIITECERPDAITIGTCSDGGSQTITAAWQASDQAATAGGVVTHYAVYILPQSGAFAYQVNGLPENTPPAQYSHNGTQVQAIFAIDAEVLTTTTVDSITTLSVSGLNRYWNPATGALTTITAGTYWIAVRAMNQAEFTPCLRQSNIDGFSPVTVA